LSGFFPLNSRQLLVLSSRNCPELMGKNPKNFRPEYCFHEITGITRNRPFPGRTVRPGLPNVTPTKQISTIEYLILDHSCAFNELFALISCTPQLHRLKFLNLTDRNVDINVIEPLILLNMTDLSIQIYRMSFDEFEKLMSK